MDWLRHMGRAPPPAAVVPDRTLSQRIERAAPGVAALLHGVSEDRSHAVLDLGPAADSSLQVYSRFARRIRFADLLGAASEGGWSGVLRALPAQPERPYDLLFAWDVLDRIDPRERPRLVERLAELSAEDARLYVAVDASGSATTRPLRFGILDVDRVSYEPAGPSRPARSPLLPAEVERLLAPFHVVRAFTLKGGLREYVALRERS